MNSFGRTKPIGFWASRERRGKPGIKLQWAGSRERNLASGRGVAFFLTSLFIELIDRGSECKRLWLLKNSLFVSNGQNWGDRKCLPNPRRSIVGLPDAILFLPISQVGVFQQPRLFTSIEKRGLGYCRASLSVAIALRSCCLAL